MAAPIVYRWDDGNAPVARGERRSLVDILRACLVDGYGTKPAAGWTLVFINATFDKAAFRNNPVTGTGFYLQIDGAGGVNAHQPKIQAFESMTSEADGLFPFNPGSLFACDTSSIDGTVARPWVLIADDRFFYFACWYNITTAPTAAQYNTSGLIFGDIVALSPDDQFACALSGSNYGFAGGMSSPNAASGSTYGLRFSRKSSGAIGSNHLAALVQGGGPGGGGAIGSSGMTYDANKPMYISRPFVNDGASYTIRGYVPGMHYSCYAPVPFNQLEVLTFDGLSFMYLHITGEGGNICTYLISLDDWRA